jgi:hypothetical protein
MLRMGKSFSVEEKLKRVDEVMNAVNKFSSSFHFLKRIQFLY